MKAKTIAKLTRILIALVVAFIFAVPVLAGFNNFQMTSGQIVGTDSNYELDEMTADDLYINISNAVTEPTKDYSISYTCKDDSKKVIYLNFSVMDETARKAAIENAAKAILNDPSSADYYKTGTKATLLDSEGKIVKQQTIVANKNIMETIMYTGMKLSSSAVKTFTPEVSINTRNGGELIKISDVSIIPSDDSFIVKIKIPYIVLATALAENQNITLAIGLTYNNFFDMDLSLDLPLKTFLGEDYEPPKIVVDSPAKVTIDLSLIGLENMDMTVGKVNINVKDGKLTVTALEGTIVSNLESYRNAAGELEFKIDSETYKLDKEMSDSLISIVKSIMEGA